MYKILIKFVTWETRPSTADYYVLMRFKLSDCHPFWSILAKTTYHYMFFLTDQSNAFLPLSPLRHTHIWKRQWRTKIHEYTARALTICPVGFTNYLWDVIFIYPSTYTYYYIFYIGISVVRHEDSVLCLYYIVLRAHQSKNDSFDVRLMCFFVWAYALQRAATPDD